MIRREEIRWIPRKPDCTSNVAFITVDINVVKPAINLMLFGFVLSVIIVSVELISIRITQHFKVKSFTKNISILLVLTKYLKMRR